MIVGGLIPPAEMVHWGFATGFLTLGLLLLAETTVGRETWGLRPWRRYLWPGLLFFFALFGRMHGSLYLRAKLGDPRCVVLYGLSVYPLLMQFFQDQYLSLLTTWVQLGLLVWLCFRRTLASGAAA